MKFISAIVSTFLAVSAAKDVINVPLNKRANRDVTLSKKHDNSMLTQLSSYSKDVTWAPDYIGNIWVGTPGQQMDIVFDSGSGMLIVATDNCTQCSPVANSNGYYDEYYPSYSTSVQPTEYECIQGEQSAGCPTITYGSANVDTVRMRDTVCFNGVLGKEIFATSTSQCVENYPVFAIQQATGITGGILGLTPACGGLAPDCTPYVKMLYNQGTISEPIISFNLGQESMWLDNMTASLMIGGIDNQYVSGTTHYLKGYTTNYWAPQANGMYYDGNIVDAITTPTETELQQGTYKMAVMDTGTSLMALSQTILDNLQPSFSSAASAAGCQTSSNEGMFMMDCGCSKVVDQFKDFDFVINGNIQITMSPYAYLQEDNGVCFVAIQGIPSSVSGMNMYLLGDTFLRHFYTIFNYETNEIGLALNSQYVNDDYTESFLQTNKKSSWTQNLAKYTQKSGSYFVKIQEIPPVGQNNDAVKLYIAVSVTAAVVIISGVALFIYKRMQMKKRAASKDMRDIKGRAAVGFEDSEQKLVAQEQN